MLRTAIVTIIALLLVGKPLIIKADYDEPLQHFMPWKFVTYDEPDLKAEIKGEYAPQIITLLDKREDGWALMDTVDGYCWVYLIDNLRFINKTLGLYDNKGDVIPATILSPQNVKIIEQDSNWLQIETWMGAKWIDLLFTPPQLELHNAISFYGDTVSVYYENIETGYSYGYDADKVYFAASVIKAPYALYIYNLAENKQADLTSLHTYTAADQRGGTGDIKDMKKGTVFTESELLKYTIRRSDNVALKMLIDKYGINGFKDFVNNLNINPARIRTVTGANMTANEAGTFAKEIYNYIESDSEFSQQFKTDLMNTTNPMIVSNFPIVRKYGWASKAFNDMAIVYSESPYILVIMSERDGGELIDFNTFKEISIAVQAFNEKYFKASKDVNTSNEE